MLGKAGVFTISSLFWLLYGCGVRSATKEMLDEENSSRKEFMEEVYFVDTVSAKYTTFQKELISNGKLLPMMESQLRFKLEGEITNIYVQNGQWVNKGDTLAQLYPFTQKNNMAQAQRTLEKAKLDMQDVLLGFGYRWEDRDSIELPENILKMARSKSGYDQALTDLEIAKHEYHLLWLTAPYTGIIANLEAKPFNMTKDFDPFCYLLSNTRYEVVFSILETELRTLQRGQSVTVMPFAFPNTQYEGMVKSINPLVDEYGMVKVKAIVNKGAKDLIAGMNVKVYLKDEVPEQLIVPKSAVVIREGREVIFTYQNDSAYWNYIDVGLENSTHYTINKGIDRGVIVITEGNLNLSHQVPVAVK